MVIKTVDNQYMLSPHHFVKLLNGIYEHPKNIWRNEKKIRR